MADDGTLLARMSELDCALVAAVKNIKLLGALSWPLAVQAQFLEGWRRKNPLLPKVDYAKSDHSAAREALQYVFLAADTRHPLGDYLRRTAQSWIYATELLDAAGTPAITEHSVRLFGRPGDCLPGGAVSNLDAARHFIELADELGGQLQAHASAELIPAERLATQLQQDIDAFFVHDKVRVELDAQLTAKAAAGPNRIRLRAGTCFSDGDRNQLLQHEAFVHTLTALNGRAQPNLKSLALNSPRITATQEGLATFAELMSGAIDIDRLKRISLRIVAIDKALDGANFLEVFKFFLDAGQSETDSFTSAMRVFRGAPLDGGAAFTKDTVYLHGLLSVHTFFRWALGHGKLALCRNLFAGKMTLHDVRALQPWFDSGYLAPPAYIPPWVRNAHGLAGTLAFSLFANRIRLDRVDADDLVLGV